MKPFLRWLGLLAGAVLALQFFFVARIASMAVLDPQSTAFERSEAWRMLHERAPRHWHQQWVAYPLISDNLKRAVIASEDDGFNYHDGVDWNALEKAWQKNAQAEARAAKSQLARKPPTKASSAAAAKTARAPKIVGGSTITQQLAKNLFLSGERTLLRKGQELVLTLLLESLLSKQRILEIYLNIAELGPSGQFGAEAGAGYAFGHRASTLSPREAGLLAAILPNPVRRSARNPGPGVRRLAGTYMARAQSAGLARCWSENRGF